MSSRKRSRTDAFGGSASRTARAIAIASKIRSMYPYSEYGRAYFKRGTPSNLFRFGETYKSATPEQRRFRKEAGYIGRGAYSMKKFRSDMAQVGKIVGKPILGAIQSKAVGAIGGSGLYTGRGAYNQLFKGEPGAMAYAAPNDETDTLIISHREYLQDIFGAATSQFSVDGWSLNPALIENFPYLSQIACNYEEYEFVQLVFEYKSTVDASAVNNSSGSTGTLIMATNYNPSAPLFTNKEQMMQYHAANSGRVVEDHYHGVECDPNKNSGSAGKLTRTQPVLLNQDVKSFDLGVFQLAQVNIPSAFYNLQIGELWVSYTVKLRKPRLFSSLGCLIPENRWCSNAAPTLTNLLSTSPLYMQQNTLNIGMVQTTNNLTFTFPDFTTGVFEFQFLADSSNGFTTTNASVTTGGNVALYYDLLGTSTGTGNTPHSIAWCSSGYQLIFICRLRVNPVVGNTDNTLTFTLTGTVTMLQSQVIIRQVNPTLGASASNSLPIYVTNQGQVTAVV